MKIYRTMAALTEEPLTAWGIDSWKVSEFGRLILENLLWDLLDERPPVMDFEQACEGLSPVNQEHALEALEFLLKMEVVEETTPFRIKLRVPEHAMILSGFYPESHLHLAATEESLLTLGDGVEALVDNLGVGDAAIEIACRMGVYGKDSQGN